MSIQDILSRQETLNKAWHLNLNKVLSGRSTIETVYEGNATGLSHYYYPGMAHEIDQGDVLDVLPHTTNKYDPNATGLYRGGKQIGWIPKAMNFAAAKALAEGLTLSAYIYKHDRGTSDLQSRLFVLVTASNTLKNSNKPPPWVNPQVEIMSHPSKRYEQPVIVKDETNFLICTPPLTNKDMKIMATKSLNAIVEQNISLGTSAAFLEAGRIANAQLSSIASKKLPIMVRAYADTAVGRLLLANIALMAKDHFRPNDERRTSGQAGQRHDSQCVSGSPAALRCRTDDRRHDL